VRGHLVGALIAFVLLSALPGAAAHSLGAAQTDEPERFVSELFGVTISWDANWQPSTIQDEDGFVWIFLEQNGGATELSIWAMPAFGGNEDVCIAGTEKRLLADSCNSDVEPAGAPDDGPIDG
jgi:hypothetical protein